MLAWEVSQSKRFAQYVEKDSGARHLSVCYSNQLGPQSVVLSRLSRLRPVLEGQSHRGYSGDSGASTCSTNGRSFWVVLGVVITKASYASWSSSCFSKEYARGWTRGFPDTIRVNPPPWRLVTLRSWVQPPLRPSSQKQWYLQCFLHYRAVKPR